MGHDIDYSLLPAHIRYGAQEYIERGHLPGHFLTAVIENNLKESFGKADETNHERMFDIVSFFYNEAPADCWGSVDRVRAWVSHDGLAGMGEGAG